MRVSDLRGKTVLITGATSDIGVATARQFAEAGARLALVGRSRVKLEQCRARLAADVSIYECDLRDAAAIERLHTMVTQELGDLDVLIQLAGVWHDGAARLQGPLLPATAVAAIDDVLDVGLRAPMLLSRLATGGMIRRGGGKMVCMSCGFAGAEEAVGWLHYYVANLAVRQFVAGLAAELRPHAISVNAVAPWFVATAPVQKFYPDQAARALDPSEVARMIFFLSSAAADHISGQTIELRSKSDY